MAKSKAQIEFEAKTSGFTSGIKSMDQSLTTLRKELNLNSAELKENADDVELLSKRKDILQQESEATAKKIELMNNKLTEAERLFGSSSKEVYQLSNKILDTQTAFQKIQNEISQTDSKLDKLENGLNENEQELKQVEKASQDLEGGFSVLKGAIAGLVADGVQQLTGSLKDLAIESDTSMGKFQAQTGLSNEEMIKFESTIEDIYSKNFGESISDIANAMAEVKQQTKETDPSNLQKMTENALALRDTFDFDVKESIRAVNMLTQQFGITGEEAFNLIVQGAQNGLNKNGDLLDVINEYSVHYKQLGFTSETFFQSLTNGTANGTFSVDKLGDAMKEFGIRVKDNSDGTRQAFKDLGFNADKMTKAFAKGGDTAQKSLQDVWGALYDLDDPIKQNEIGVALFGSMWEDLGVEAINGLTCIYEYLPGVNVSIDKTKKSMEEMTKVRYDNVTSQFQEMGRSIQMDVLVPIAEDLLPVLRDGLSWLKDNLNWLLPTITGIGIAIGTYFVVSKFLGFINVLKSLFTLVKSGTGIMTALNTVMALNPIALIVSAVVGLIAVFVLLWNKCDGFREFWINLWEGIKNAFNVVVNWFKDNWKTLILFLMNPIAGLFKYFYDNFEGFRNFVDNFISSIKEFFTNLWSDIKEGASNIWEGIKGAWSSFVNWIDTNIVQPVINFFKSLWDGLVAIWDGIVLAVKIAIGLIASVIDAGLQIILLPFTFIWENCKQYVFQAWEWIKNAISTAINFISGIITTVFTAISTFFTTIWEGIKTTFTNAWNSIVSFITPIINNIKNFITTTFNNVKTTISTILNNIKNTCTTIWNNIKTTISNVLNAIKTTATTIWNNIKNAITNVINGIKNVITNVFNAIKTFASNVWNGIKNVIITPIKNAWTNVKTTANNIKNGVVDTFNSLKSKVTSIFNKVKDSITKPINTAKDKVKGIVNTMKGFFDFEFKVPKIKKPNFGITPKGWKVGDLLEGKIPKLNITWNKEGAIFRKPTLFDTRSGYQGVGEAGAEAVLPIEKLENWMNNGFNHIASSNSYANDRIERLIEVAEDILAKDTNIYMDKEKVGQSMASTNDNISGQRYNFKNRGVLI